MIISSTEFHTIILIFNNLLVSELQQKAPLPRHNLASCSLSPASAARRRQATNRVNIRREASEIFLPLLLLLLLLLPLLLHATTKYETFILTSTSGIFTI